MITKMRERMNSDESGFTLIELLVVIIIIGILAAIAIPIFLNQQKTARDGATTSDVRNIATNLQSMLTAQPEGSLSVNTGDGGLTVEPSTNPDVFGWTASFEGGQKVDIAGTPGTYICVAMEDGVFHIWGNNPDGNAYTGNDNWLHYASDAGGLQGAVPTTEMENHPATVNQMMCSAAASGGGGGSEPPVLN